MRTDLDKPFDNYHQPDPHSQDFRDVLDWLKASGAPEPNITYYFLDNTGFPNGGNPGKQMVLTFGEPNPSTVMDAGIVMNAPGVALLLLGLTPAISYNYEPPKPPAQPAPLPPGQPANPIGVLWFVSRLGVKTFQPAPGDALPDRALWPDPATNPASLFMKTVVPQHMGTISYWEQLR